jgi:hypothetical protein
VFFFWFSKLHKHAVDHEPTTKCPFDLNHIGDFKLLRQLNHIKIEIKFFGKKKKKLEKLST